jgi:uncharacterized LabA/DUF88 family protein
MERVMVFIDGSNFHHGVLDYCGKSDSCLDHHKLSVAIANNRKLIRAYYYTARIINDGTPKAAHLEKTQQRLISKLNRTPYLEVRYGRMTKVGGTYSQKGVDTAIAVDMIMMAVKDLYDVAVLISADSDLAEATKRL